MAYSDDHFSIILPILTLLLVLPNTCSGIACFTHIFSFGDSLIDNGNLLHSLGSLYHPVGHLPYGETFFGRPTGRFSDGRIIIDFIAEAFGLPIAPPAYLTGLRAEDFRHGANFAVAGATSLNNSFFAAMGMEVSWTEYSLSAQLQWFKNLLPLLSSESDYSDVMNRSLFIVGEIGGDDYNHPLLDRRFTTDQVRTFVPLVVDAIASAISDLIKLGAKTLVVPGDLPNGCVPIYLSLFRSENEQDYDPQTGCLKWVNEFSEHHNKLLVEKLHNLRELHPRATIIYADYYRALMNIYQSPRQFGFDYPLLACCGSHCPFDCSIRCGNEGSKLCPEPSTYISWDGMHLTEAANKVVAEGVLWGPYAVPALADTCPYIEHSSA